MSADTFTRFQCWRDERIGAVINVDAIAVDRTNFLATHAPMTGMTYERGLQAEGVTSEDGLLQELLRLSNSDEHGFAVVEGIPGSGKSHLIRWLMERYVAENRERESSKRDVVLLIERATSSLRGTLRQIAESEALRASGVYDDTTIADQLERIRTAANSLSSEGLADSLLGMLIVASKEMSFPDESVNRRISNGAEPLLLDQTVRSWLKRPNGPIERLTRFLAEGRQGGVAAGETPGFEASDFDFDAGVLRKLSTQGYDNARILADALADPLRQNYREDFAQFLNRRLNFAVGRVTSLAADDLKSIFNDLRRALKQRGFGLTLFIEDITSFTGIDIGLVDVLATQHTGMGNQQFCRIISVVGITPDYYLQRFPDNLKQRVTHHIRLSSDHSGQADARPTLRQEAVSDLVARYLNAIRLTQDELHRWVDDGAQPEHLPNRCVECRYRPTCHRSFGYVEIGGPDDETLHLGLYPFNAPALETMFARLDPAKAPPTPRSLLNSVLRHVLAIHGPSVERGEFPPPRALIGKDFGAPPLTKPAQGRIILSQASDDADRVESLLTFWGDGTADATETEDGRRVGGLSAEIFRAFDVLFIQGADDVNLPPPPPLPPQDDGNESNKKTKVNRYHEDIDRWAANGKLNLYEDLRSWLSAFAKGAIDWEAHGVAAPLVAQRLTPRRIRIEGQHSTAQGDHFTLRRNDALTFALRAVADLGSRSDELDAPTTAGHLLSLRLWLDEIESNVVEFVRRPNAEQPEPVPYHQLLVMDGLLLESLSGRLSPERTTPRQLLDDLVAGSATALIAPERANREWETQITEVRDSRSDAWLNLMRRIGAGRAQTTRVLLLQALNRAQGGRSNVVFIDAVAALDAIDAFRKTQWSLPAGTVSGRLAEAWAKPWEVFESMRELYPTAITCEHAHVRDMRATLHGYLGSDSPSKVFATMDEFITTLNQFGESPGRFELQADTYSARSLSHWMRRLDLAADSEQTADRILRLSAALPIEQQIFRYNAFFEAFVKLLDMREESARRAIDQRRGKQSIQLRDEVLQLYEAIEENTDSPADPEENLYLKEAVE